MHTVTNLSPSAQHFRCKDGALETLAPRESKKLALAKRDSVQNTAREHAGVISIDGDAAKKASPKPASGVKTDPAA